MKKYLNPKKYFRYIKRTLNPPPLSDVPWIAPAAVKWLDNYLTKDMTVFEWGSGGSTKWIAKRVKKIISIEHNPKWYRKVKKELKGVSNCELRLERVNDNHHGIINSFPEKFDLVFIDGAERVCCMFIGKEKVKDGGYLMLDNSQRIEFAPSIEVFFKGWKRKDFHKPKDCNLPFGQTSIFRK